VSPTKTANPSWNAATLDERIAHVRGRMSAASGPNDADVASSAPSDGVLAPWAAACALGNLDGLARRLSWDGIDIAAARAALAETPPAHFPVSPWVGRLEELSAEALLAARSIAGPEWARDVSVAGRGLPFAEAWLPVLRVARRDLSTRVPAWRAWLSTGAMDALEGHLVLELARFGELAMLEDFQARPRNTSTTRSAPVYATYVHELLAARYGEVLGGLPVLARQVVLILEQWVRHTSSLVTRLEQDQQAIEATFGLAAGAILRLTPGLSDRHDGGGRVLAAEFASGLKLAYKPRDVRLEAAFHEWVGWLRREGLEAAPCPLRVADRGTHGWIEWAEHAPIGTPASAQAYFRSAGVLTCLAYVLGAADLHGENIVATVRGPIVVDAEMLLQPSIRTSSGSPSGPDDTGGDDELDSCLASGLVSAVVIDRDGEAFDVGGLQPSAARTTAIPRRKWLEIGGDQIRFVREHRIHPRLHNDVAAEDGGRILPPDDFAAEVCEGFASAWKFLRRHRPGLLADGGPLAGFEACTARVLFRPSDQYAAAQYLMAAPAYQRRGLDRSLAIETFYRVFARDLARPRLWPLAHDERQALEFLDIPRMTLPAAASDITAATGEVVAGFYVRSGVDNVRSRLSRLDGDHLERQLDLLRSALGVFDGPAAAAAQAAGTNQLLPAAERIGDVLLARACEGPGASLMWRAAGTSLDLYSGACGIGLFFAALARATGSGRWHEAAHRVWRTVDAGCLRRPPLTSVGICSGRASIPYAMALAGTLLNDENLVARARDQAAAIPEDAIGSDVVLDVEGGAAGALLAFLAVDAAAPDARLRALAARCASRLVAAQVRKGPEHGAWASGVDGRAHAGFAHGAAGIAYALGRWARHSGSGETGAAIRDAWGFERRLHAGNDGTWPTIRRDGSRLVMATWCHGAPGIALARALATSATGDPELMQEIVAAMTLTLSAPPSDFDHPCCGNLGRAEAALIAGLRCGNSDWISHAMATTRAAAARIMSGGRRGMRAAGFKGGAPVPGFFQGLSGIGYQLLRIATPFAVPSVLAFEPGVRAASNEAG
jgi:type 2 lantibiotic biosynthesis protein LanM